MADNRKYYYLKLKENFFDSDSIVLLEDMKDGILYSNILLKLYLKSLKNGGKLQLDEHIPYTAQMIATLTRHQIGTVERALEIFRQLGLVEQLDSGAFYMTDIELMIGQSSTEAERKRAARLENKALLPPRTKGGHLSDIRPPEIELEKEMHDFDSSMFFRWIFKSAFAILIVSNTWNIVMGIFDATQSVVNQSAGVIIGETSVDFNSLIPDLESQLEAMSVGGLLGLWFQTLVVGLTMNILAICIFLVTYGRMIEIYVVTSLGPIPLATMGNSEWRGMGQNYLKSLLALGFQAFLIMVVVGIYAVLIQNIASASDISGAIWGCMGYTVLLCFCLFKTGSISKSVFSAH